MKVTHFLLFFTHFIAFTYAVTTPCDLRTTAFGSVCVCTTAYCDYLDDPQPNGDNSYVVVSSNQAGLRFATTNGSFNQTSKLLVGETNQIKDAKFDPVALLVENNRAFLQLSNVPTFNLFPSSTKQVTLEVNRTTKYQKIVGFGGAFTGTVSHLLDQLPQDLQDHVYKSFFHKTGINFNTIRMSIGGCDFDLEPWAYNELPTNDAQLTNFTKLDPRDEHKIEQLNQLKLVAELKDLKIMATAWSPPPWMKSNGEWTGFSSLKDEYYQTWADYHLRFLELMSAKNMPVWAITTGNEPLNGVIGWLFVRFMSLGWTPGKQAVWVNDHLGPTIRNSTQKDVLIFSNDDQRYTYPGWFRKMKAERPEVLNYLDGLAVHFYWDDVFPPNLIEAAIKDMPDKIVLNTESSVGDKPWETHGPELGSWSRGEKYFSSYMQDLQHSFNGWIDWNIILNQQGGPNYVQNNLDAAVIVNTENRTEFYKQPLYYAIGHFSKFVPEGSIRIETKLSRGIGVNVEAIGFLRPDGKVVYVIYNGENSPVEITINDSVRGSTVISITERSWHTVISN